MGILIWRIGEFSKSPKLIPPNTQIATGHNSAQRGRMWRTRINSPITFLDQFANFNACQNNRLYGNKHTKNRTLSHRYMYLATVVYMYIYMYVYVLLFLALVANSNRFQILGMYTLLLRLLFLCTLTICTFRRSFLYPSPGAS